MITQLLTVVDFFNVLWPIEMDLVLEKWSILDIAHQMGCDLRLLQTALSLGKIIIQSIVSYVHLQL